MAEMVEHSTKERKYIQRWVLLSILIGIVAGFGAFAFYLLLQIMTDFFLRSEEHTSELQSLA